MVGDKETENEVLLLEHDIPHSSFSQAVLSCLPQVPWGINDEVSTIPSFWSHSSWIGATLMIQYSNVSALSKYNALITPCKEWRVLLISCLNMCIFCAHLPSLSTIFLLKKFCTRDNFTPLIDYLFNMSPLLYCKVKWLIINQDLQKRTDLRHLDICSVDPPGCTDIDDALHCRRLENGNFEVRLVFPRSLLNVSLLMHITQLQQLFGYLQKAI